MSIITNLILISTIVTLIIDHTDFVVSIKRTLKKKLDIKGELVLKPFDCSLCSTFWVGIAYLTWQTQLTLVNLTALVLIATSTDLISAIYTLIKDLVTKVITQIYKIID